MRWRLIRARLRRLLIVVCWLRGHVFCSQPMIVRTTTTSRISLAGGDEVTALHHGFHVGDRVVIQYLHCDRCGRRRR